MGTHPIFESDFDCLTERRTWPMVLRRLLSRKPPLPGNGKRTASMVTDSSGAYLDPPHVTAYAGLKYFIYVIPFVTAGAMISKHGAKFLEEYELFVPDDDDEHNCSSYTILIQFIFKEMSDKSEPPRTKTATLPCTTLRLSLFHQIKFI